MAKPLDTKDLNPYAIAGRLLISDDYIVIPEELARLLGLQGAALLKQIDALTASYEKHENQNFYHDGHYWVKGSLSWFASRYPYLGSESTIKRIVSDLEKQGLLISSTHNKLRQDRSKSYRCDRQKLGELYLCRTHDTPDHQVKMTQSSGQSNTRPSGQNDPVHQVKMTQSSSGQNDPVHQVKMTSSLYEATLSNSLSNCVSNSEPDRTHPNPIARSPQKTEPSQSAPSDCVIEAEVIPSQESSRSDALVPLFSSSEKTDPLSVLMELRPDPDTYAYRNWANNAAKREMVLSPQKFYPWNTDRNTLVLFIEFMVAQFSKSYPKKDARSVVQTWLTKANQCIPDRSKKDYSQVEIKWSQFLENAEAVAQSAEPTIAQLINPKTEAEKRREETYERVAESDRQRREQVAAASAEPDLMWTNPDEYRRRMYGIRITR